MTPGIVYKIPLDWTVLYKFLAYKTVKFSGIVYTILAWILSQLYPAPQELRFKMNANLNFWSKFNSWFHSSNGDPQSIDIFDGTLQATRD